MGTFFSYGQHEWVISAAIEVLMAGKTVLTISDWQRTSYGRFLHHPGCASKEQK
jgi:hypothetical protein